ncbi:MAG: hypothetical protein KF678_03290 [Phycisphaeraceae bacterium]|nr:hypothetical protein [Phycisphaeraceae bacterium]
MPRPGPRRLRICSYVGLSVALALGLIGGVNGCRAKPIAKPTTALVSIPDERPPDLAIAATVFSPRVPLPASNLPRSLKPGRYIIEADGVLRSAQGAQAPDFPPRTRQLTPRQMDQLWRLIRDAGFLNEGNPAIIDDPAGTVRSGDRTTAMLYVSYGGRRVTLRHLLDRSTPDAVQAELFIDRLAELAWVD